MAGILSEDSVDSSLLKIRCWSMTWAAQRPSTSSWSTAKHIRITLRNNNIWSRKVDNPLTQKVNIPRQSNKLSIFTCELTIILQSIYDLLEVFIKAEEFAKELCIGFSVLSNSCLVFDDLRIYKQSEILFDFLLFQIRKQLLNLFLLKFLEICCF